MTSIEITDSATLTGQQDENAVAAVRRGDAERYRELVERHERRVFAIAWSRLGDAALAEEATQEAFIRAYRRLWLLGDGAKFSGWVNTIARRVAINFGLRRRRELDKRERWALEQPEASAVENAAGEGDPLRTPETLRQTLAELPAAHRECLVLFYLEGKSGAEAAAALGISEAALRVRLHRARGVMRERMEEKLEDSLQKLRPSQTLTPAIMASVTAASAGKATAGGTAVAGLWAKILSVAGKTFLFSWLLPLLSVIATLPSLIAVTFIMRKERENFRDAEGFRPELHRRFFRSFIWGFPLLVLAFFVINRLALTIWGIHWYQFATACFVLMTALVSLRSLTIARNPYQVGMFAYCAIMVVGLSAAALGWLPPSLASLPILLSTIVLFSFYKKRPMRMDYSLFLRAAHRLLKTSGMDETLPSAKNFDRRELLAFARFLASRYLAINFCWKSNGLLLRLPPVGNRFLRNMAAAFLPPISQNCSYISLGWDGDVTAHCGNTDARDLAELKTSSLTDPRGLEGLVVKCIVEAWQEFRSGNLSATERILGDSPEAEVFVVPPAKAASMRWWRIFMGATVVLMMLWIAAQIFLPKHSSFYLKPVNLTEAQVRDGLAQKADVQTFAQATKYYDNVLPVFNLVLPPTNLMSGLTLEKIDSLISANFPMHSTNTSSRIEILFDSPMVQKAILNGWFTEESLGVPAETIRQTVAKPTKWQLQFWLNMQTNRVMNSKVLTNGQIQHIPADYTVLDVDKFALTVQCLKKLGCLDAVNGTNAVETLLRHQMLSDEIPPGRRQLPNPKVYHGMFLTYGQNPIRDTYSGLVVLQAFGALGRIDREACVQGILRFHEGKGLFGWDKPKDLLVLFGDAHETLAAYESLRMLGALDRVKDLSEWKFRPMFTSASLGDGKSGPATWDEMEAWVCQERLDKTLQERKENSQAPFRSLLEP